jgi:formamidopyrimidine-DNA glycosylase
MDGGVRFYKKGEPVVLPKAVKSASHAYLATIELDDGSSLSVNLYGWGTLFKVFDFDMSKVCDRQTAKSKRYPFLPKAPIDLTDNDDFTYERFTKWLKGNPALNIIECCATAKGAFRIDNPLMNYILLVSQIHPRTKARALTEKEIRVLYDNTAKIIREYQAGERICKHTDIYGIAVQPQNDVLWMTKAILGTPCPICGAPIDATPAAGTKMYYCPDCQVMKK